MKTNIKEPIRCEVCKKIIKTDKEKYLEAKIVCIKCFNKGKRNNKNEEYKYKKFCRMSGNGI